MEKYLIINADDFGMCRSANYAVYDLLQKGSITSATIMAPCGWSAEAARFAHEHPEYAIGVHLTTTSEWNDYRWGPVSSGDTSSLRDEQFCFYHRVRQFEENADLHQVEQEIRAQIEKLKAMGLTPSHLDNHMGTLYGIKTGRFELLEKTLEIAAEYKLPFRMPKILADAEFENSMLGIAVSPEIVRGILNKLSALADAKGVVTPDFLMPGEWSGPQKESYENYKEYIYELYRKFPEGVTETYIHPALETEELKGTTSVWQRRVWEYRLFSDPQTLQHIHALGIKLINYRDLYQMRCKK